VLAGNPVRKPVARVADVPKNRFEPSRGKAINASLRQGVMFLLRL